MEINKIMRINRRVLTLLLVITILFSLSGCNNQSLVTKIKPEEAENYENQEEVSDNKSNKKRSGSGREKIAEDFSSERFDVSGNNAFYILPGLENHPSGMAVFDVLDYNSLGEFVYYYVTPCYISPEELNQYNDGDKKSGKNPDLQKMEDPKERTDDYRYDAVVLMSYNPDSGDYHVMYARAYEIDKEKEFDPVTQERPFYYPVDSDERLGDYRSYLVQRAMGCKVANREEYLFIDQGGLMGKVYNVYGEVSSIMAYQTTLNDEIWNKRKFLNEKLKNNSLAGSATAPMNVIVTDVAMTENYETYLGARFFIGDDPLDMDSVQIATTYMIYNQQVNDEDGGMPYISVNYNAEKQAELWKSLDGRFFSSREEYESVSGCSMTEIKKGKYGEDYEDSFSPFITGTGMGDGSVLVEIPDIRQIPGAWYDKEYANNIIESAPMKADQKYWFKEYFNNYKGGLKRGDTGDMTDTMMGMHLFETMTTVSKKASQTIIADALMKQLNTGADLSKLVKSLLELGWIPAPGAFKDDNDNKPSAPRVFIGGNDYNTSMPDSFTDNDDYNISPFTVDKRVFNYASIAYISDHALSVVSSNGIYKTYVSPLDYYADTGAREGVIEEVSMLKMKAFRMTPSLNRICYIFDTETADEQLEEIEKTEKMSESEIQAIDELKELLRYSEADMEYKKIDWLISYIFKKAKSSLDDEEYDEDEDDDEDDDEDYDEDDLEDALKDALDDDIEDKLNEKMDDELENMLLLVDDLSKEIPKEIREGILYLCAGFCIQSDMAKEYPLAYKVKFPTGSVVTVNDSGQAETVGGSSDSFNDGVLVNAESSGEWYKGNSYLVGYQGVKKMNLFKTYTYGKPVDVTSLEYYNGSESRTIVVQSTDKGVRFFEKKDETNKVFKSYEELKNMLGEDEADLIKENFEKTGSIYDEYEALKLGDRGAEAYEKAKKEASIDNRVKKEDFDGFMSYEMLLTSSGYTRDTENRLDDAIAEGLEKIALSDNEVSSDEAEDRSRKIDGNRSISQDSFGKSTLSYNSTINDEMNKRYVGHLTSAKSISLISKEKALICSMQDGTKILDLEHGTVADDMKGSYYQAFQKKGSEEFKIVGFESSDQNYMDTDIPRAKVYTVDYGKNQLERSIIDSFKKMLEQYALDYLHRDYRTEINDEDEIVVKEQSEEEKKESTEAGKIFSPSVQNYDYELLLLERDYGIDSSPQEIREYVEEIRKKIAGVKPAITKIYELAGATKLAGDMEKRNEGYWKNLESRMTMAVETDALYDILVEIRLNDDVLSAFDSEKAEEYRSYKELTDLNPARGKVSADDLFREGSASRNSVETENDIRRYEYRNKIINDIIDEYVASLQARKPKKAQEEEAELSYMEKKELFDDYLRTLLDRVNPANFALDDEKAAREFVELLNHGRLKLSDEKVEEMADRLLPQIPEIDAVWKLEEMIISEKIEHDGGYSEYKDWLSDYNERVMLDATKGGQVVIPVETGEDKTEEKTALSGTERVSYLRTSEAYKDIIGELKGNSEVRLFLSGRKETWDDYLKYVIKKSGAGVVRNEKGEIIDSDED
ncbi:hypothetical protein QYZ88_013810 [Lachnospiraceae bacterium C1.1]|nr:hypothetical protein [Lachnospiraceae bacterium C1.1]